jgi:hypothetical protein
LSIGIGTSPVFRSSRAFAAKGKPGPHGLLPLKLPEDRIRHPDGTCDHLRL